MCHKQSITQYKKILSVRMNSPTAFYFLKYKSKAAHSLSKIVQQEPGRAVIQCCMVIIKPLGTDLAVPPAYRLGGIKASWLNLS